MKCPVCYERLRHMMIKNTIIDYCPCCNGIWFDKDEVLLFSHNPENLEIELGKGLKNIYPSERICPRCGSSMSEGELLSSELLIDECTNCHGLWFDANELNQLHGIEKNELFSQVSKNAIEEIKSIANEAKTVSEFITKHPLGSLEKPSPSKVLAPISLTNLALTSTMTIIVLYSLLGVFMILLAELNVITDFTALLIVVGSILLNFLISPYILDLMLAWMFISTKVSLEELPASLREFLKTEAKKNKIPIPQIRIIEDYSLNAFTYGHVPQNARLVLTRGILEILNEDEIVAVVGHELGHIIHWDMLIMTLASCVPIILYYMFRLFSRLSKSRSGNNRGNPFPILAIIAYLLYIIAEYVVLYLSRLREYFADEYSAQTTKNPNALSKALVKIAYGLVSDNRRSRKSLDEQEESRGYMKAFQTLGIFSFDSAKALVANSLGLGSPDKLNPDNLREDDKERIKDAMQWDLFSPWALYYEMNSTHPLPAKRINRLSKLAFQHKQVPFIVFDRVPKESYWDEFLVDVFFASAPWLGIMGGVIAGAALPGENAMWGFICIGLGIGMLLKTIFSYRGNYFIPSSVAGLLKKVKVSRVRSIPVKLKGKIIGRGIPGYFLSEDLVLMDKTGFMFLDYRQPLWIFEIFFALSARNLIGKEVVVEGYYRRAPMPFVEIYRLKFPETKRCYVREAKLIVSILVFCFGLYLLFAL